MRSPREFIVISRRDVRLASGLVLFTYVALHLVCHAFGLVSLQAAEQALHLAVLVWHSLPGTVLLYGAVASHVALAFLAVYDRRTLRMSPLQAFRILLGLGMPMVLIGHFVATRYAFEHFGLAAEYQRVVPNIWANNRQGLQLALLAPGWLHGCLGLNFAFGARRWWRRSRDALFATALLLPVLAGLGFVGMGREIERAPEMAVSSRDRAGDVITPEQGAHLGRLQQAVVDGYVGLIVLVAAARRVRSLVEKRRHRVVRIAYPGRQATVPRGWTVLEASRSFGIPHQAMCGGRARCTTCRVRVVEGQASCPPPGADEARALARLQADSSVRLACQLRPGGDISVMPLVAVDDAWWRPAAPLRPTSDGVVALLFVDAVVLATDTLAAIGRDSPGGPVGGSADAISAAPGRTMVDRTRRAHDTMFALDRIDTVVLEAARAVDGVQCRHVGGSWMFLFGPAASNAAGTAGPLDEAAGIEAAGRRALTAAVDVGQRLDAVVQRLHDELGLAVATTCGVHVGPAVVGLLGQGSGRALSAVGEAIDAADRLRDVARLQSARFVLSCDAAVAASLDEAAFDWHESADRDDAGASPLRWAATSAAMCRRQLDASVAA